MTFNRFLRALSGASVCALGAAVPFAAIAQTTSTPAQSPSEPGSDAQDANSKTAGVADIVVTARKTSESAQKAPATIDVVSADQLMNSAILVPTDLNKILPSARLTAQGPVADTYIRGVGSSLDFPWTSPATAITYDGIVIPRYGTRGIMFDLSRVEQIAGPQGTLYGGTAAGGAINFITQRPGDGFGGNAMLEGGNYGTFHGLVNQDIRLSDELSFRGSVDYNRHDPYESGGFFSSDRTEGRGSLLYKPNEDLTALFFVSDYRETGLNASAMTLAPLADDPWKAIPTHYANGAPINSDNRYNNSNTFVAGANIDLRLGGGTLTYIPGYVRVKDDYTVVLTSGILEIHDSERQFSNELRWNATFGRLRLNAGVFWLHNETVFSDGISLPILSQALGYYRRIPVLDSTDQKNTSYSGFIQGTYSINGSLRVTLGGRLSRDEINAVGTGSLGAFTFREGQTTPDWKAGVEYDVAPRILLYANIQTGYIPKAYNPDAGNPAPALQRSTLLAYSAGFKSRLFDNRLEINNEFYYYDYSNFQAFGLDNSTGRSVVAGAKTSRIYGDELTVRWVPTSTTSFDASLVLQNARYTDFTGPGFDYSGYRMQFAPVANLVGGVQQIFDLGDHGSILARVQGQYNSGIWGNFAHGDSFAGAYVKGDATLTYTFPRENWKIQGYVNNFTNKATFTSRTPAATGTLEAPRTYGVRFIASWR